MKQITDIQIGIKIEIRFFMQKRETNLFGGKELILESFEDLKKILEEQKESELSRIENQDYDFVFYPVLYYFESYQEEVAKSEKLKPMILNEVEKLFHYITEILFVNTSEEITHSFNYREIAFFIDNL